MSKKMLTALLCLLLAATAAFSQDENNNVTYNDTIVKLGQKHMAVNLLKTDSRYVVYEVPDTPGERQQIERKNVQRIIHKTGRVEVFNKPLMQMVEGKKWQTVVLTEDPEDVEGLYLLEEIRMRSGSRARSPRAARIDARIRLQKTAVNKGADIMLIITSEARGGYGEMPYYVITAEAYSFMPPEAKLEQ